jgi:NAD(P)-dependent dehydrogenase (short-subunit alcohol dehydrogenase family)
VPRPLEEAVVVITGASSGIGRAAALRFARRGSSLALCARTPEPLERVARECEAAGASVFCRPLDVADEAAVEAFADEVAERFGRIDVWVNNAGVIAYGRFVDIPSDVFRRVLETNLMGQIHGARAALRRFLPQRSGVLINLSSVWGRISTPQVTPYNISKHAVRVFSEGLRSELAGAKDIHVTTIAPEALDTPIFDHAANYSGHEIRPVPPVLSPEKVAETIEACAESPRREVSYGRAGRVLEILYALAPPLYRRLSHRAFVRGTMPAQGAPPTAGNVLAGAGPYAIEGDWRLRRRAALRRAFAAAALGALAGLMGANATPPRRRSTSRKSPFGISTDGKLGTSRQKLERRS